MKSKTRVALAGNTQALRVLLPAFRAVPAFQVVALCGRDQKAMADAAGGIDKIFSDWKPLVEDRSVDVVAIALPAAAQAEAAVALAAAGKNLFCEKPLAANVDGARAICNTLASQQRVAAVNFGFRMIEAFQDFRSIAQSGLLGEPKWVTVEWLMSHRRDPTLTWNWKSDFQLGGGALNLMGSHVLDYLAWIFGDISTIRFAPSQLVRVRPEKLSGQPKAVQAEDSFTLSMTVASNVPVGVAVSTAVSVPAGHCCRVWFEKGLLELANTPADDYHDGFRLSFQPEKSADPRLPVQVRQMASRSKMAPHFPGKIEVTRRVIEEFAHALAGRTHSAPTVADALKVQQYIDAARQSGKF